jgi:dihydrofolate reductase
MRLVRFGGAMSLDGYIAGPKGEHDWIVMDPEIDFAGIMSQFDTFLIGRKTFDVMKGMADAGEVVEGNHQHRLLADAEAERLSEGQDRSRCRTRAEAAIASRLQKDRNHWSGKRRGKELARVAESAVHELEWNRVIESLH